MIHKIIQDNVFKSSTYLYIGHDIENIRKHAKRNYNIEIEEDEFKSRGSFVLRLTCKKSGRIVWYVWLLNRRDYSAIVHEAGHLTFSILDASGVKYSEADSESFCYLLGYLSGEMLKIVKEKKR